MKFRIFCCIFGKIFLHLSFQADAQTVLIDTGGEFESERGEFILDVGGKSENMTDRIAISGDASITGGTITFNFVDGFLPRMNDQIPFFMAGGALTVGSLNFTYEGAAPGFQFEVMEENGMLMFHALNDAQPEGGDPIPRPTAINPEADVNGDKVIDADDLLEVMRNWYHVVPQ